ncbi:MAG: histidine kinase [Actinomycetota bacterium]
MSQQPHPDRVRLLPWSVPPLLVDGVLSACMALGLVVRQLVEEDVDVVVGIAGLVAAVAVVVARRRWPVPTLGAAIVGAAVLTVVAGEPTVILMASLIALYHVATLVPWRQALAAGAVTVVAFTVLVIGFLEPGRVDGGLLASIGWPAFAAAIGTAVRASRENLAGAQERARRAEATRELEVERRVVEERLRIARDVHDLVAHHLAVVNVQSGVAAHVLRSDPDAAGTALDAVRSSASTAVSELGELLGVLRDPDGSDGAGGGVGGPVTPTPDLDAIDDLITSFAASGLQVEHRVTGAPRPLTPSAEVAAYRVVQEALTNAHKHGDGSAVVAQGFDADGMTIEVTNRVAPSGSAALDPSGYGLVGMRERVDAVGGRLAVDEASGRFRVRAVLPIRETP